MNAPIRTAAHVREMAQPGALAARRDARQDETLHAVWQGFVDGRAPVPVADVVRTLPHRAEADTRAALASLDAADLIVLAGDAVPFAYPFASGPNPFAVEVAGVTCYACCAVDALGLAPMLGEPITVRSACHHCGEPIVIDVGPEGPRLPDGPRRHSEAMVWVAPRDACGPRLASGL